jgi:5-methyltetrahydropteroyltriglutamate--homocysteine methyltransferase
MKRSTDRILTTHVGSLPRPDDMLDLLTAKMRGRPIDEQAFEARLPSAVADIVRQQVDHGLDVIDDGEVSKPSFIVYVEERLSGFEPREVAGSASEVARALHYLAGSREALAFPEYYQPELDRMSAVAGERPRLPVCTGPIAYRGHRQLQRDIGNFKAALNEVQVEEAFIPAVSPNQVAYRRPNQYYRTDEEYEAAIAEALREEYQAIVDAGFLLQVDDPQLVTHYTRNPGLSIAEYRRWAEQHVELLNHALRGIPRERIRFHTCYSISFGPRVHDLELKDAIDIIVKIHAGAHSFEAANPRHEHEWKDWATAKLPEDTILIPGVVTQSTAVVEHPELVAQRIERYADLVGRERVIAGVDCGFASTARSLDMPTSVVWAKLDGLDEGARIASRRLWGRG